MGTSIRLSDQLVAQARRHGGAHNRSAPRQIEYWSRIGHLVEENPDLPYAMIRDILQARDEATAGDVTPWHFG